MNNPALSPLLRIAETARRLGAIALWFATLFGRILPGAAMRREEAEFWNYVERTMTQVAALLEREAAGKIATPPKMRARRPHPDSARTLIAARAPRTPRATAPDTPPPRALTASRALRSPELNPPPPGEARKFQKSRLAIPGDARPNCSVLPITSCNLLPLNE